MENQNSSKNHKTSIRELSPGNYFGEVSIIYDCEHSASVKALNYGTYGTISKEDCEEMFSIWPEYKERMIQNLIG